MGAKGLLRDQLWRDHPNFTWFPSKIRSIKDQDKAGLTGNNLFDDILRVLTGVNERDLRMSPKDLGEIRAHAIIMPKRVSDSDNDIFSWPGLKGRPDLSG